MPPSRERADRAVEALNGILSVMGRNRRLKVVHADNELSVVVIEAETQEVVRVVPIRDTLQVLADIDHVIRGAVSKLTD